MTAETDQPLISNLRTGEKLLWTGRPRQGIVLRPVEFVFTPFMLFYGFTVFKETLKRAYFAETSSSLAYILIFGLIAHSLVFYLLVGRFLADRYYRSKLVYGVTDQRAFIAHIGPHSYAKSVELKFLTNVWLFRFQNGLGSIYFVGEQRRTWATWFAPIHVTMGAPEQFFQIKDPQRVYDLITSAKRP